MRDYLRRSRLLLAPACLIIVIHAFVLNVNALLIPRIVDYISQKNMGLFLRYIGLMLLAYLGAELLTYIKTRFQIRAYRSLHQQLRQKILAWISRLRPQSYQETGAAAYLSYLSNDMRSLDEGYWSGIYTWVEAVAGLVIALTILLSYSPWIMLTALTFSALMLYLPRFYFRRAAEYGLALSKAQEDFVKEEQSLLDGYSILRFFGRLAYLRQRSFQASETMEQRDYEGLRYRVRGATFSRSLYCIFDSLLTLVAGYIVWRHHLSAGLVMSVFILNARLASSLATVVQMLANRSQAKAVLKKFSDLEAQALEVGDAEAGVPLDFSQEIRFEELCFAYGDKRVLDACSFSFQKGHKYALLGPSGSGKTTLIKLLLRQLQPQSGRLLIDGRPIEDYSQSSLYQNISYIDQTVYLFDGSIRENLCLGADYTDAQLEAALRRARLWDFVSAQPEGLDLELGYAGAKLSGGQRQRMAVARSLVHGSSILLMDEGSSALDPETARELEADLLADQDLTLIMVTHHLSPETKARLDAVYELSPLATETQNAEADVTGGASQVESQESGQEAKEVEA